jgi:hypothetical protein
VTAPAWMDDAACRGVDPDLWYPDQGDWNSSRAAKRICRSCPVRLACLAYAVANGEAFGVWGGLSSNDRRVLVGKRPRGDYHRAAS